MHTHAHIRTHKYTHTYAHTQKHTPNTSQSTHRNTHTIPISDIPQLLIMHDSYDCHSSKVNHTTQHASQPSEMTQLQYVHITSYHTVLLAMAYGRCEPPHMTCTHTLHHTTHAVQHTPYTPMAPHSLVTSYHPVLHAVTAYKGRLNRLT